MSSEERFRPLIRFLRYLEGFLRTKVAFSRCFLNQKSLEELLKECLGYKRVCRLKIGQMNWKSHEELKEVVLAQTCRMKSFF